MNYHTHTTKRPAFRNVSCSTIAIVITAMLSWSFFESTSTLRWMGSDVLAVAAADGNPVEPPADRA